MLTYVVADNTKELPLIIFFTHIMNARTKKMPTSTGIGPNPMKLQIIFGTYGKQCTSSGLQEQAPWLPDSH